MVKFDKSIIGMIHLDPMPGTALYKSSFKDILKKALKEAEIYKKCGIDMVAIENMHDTPYLNRTVGPEITAGMAVIGYKIKQKISLPCGIQILAGANKEALACALSADLDFIRAEGFVFSHIADEGLMNSCAGELLRYRKLLEACDIAILTDIKKKHSSHSITQDTDIAETAKAAEFFRADGVIVTGTATGTKADIEELKSVKKSVNIPVLVGSGVDIKNVDNYLKLADGLIVGSWFKYDGKWENDIDPDRVSEFMKKVNVLRK